MKIQIFDPAMCCSTGVCGPSIDPELVRIQESLRQIRILAPAVEIERSGLTSDPTAFCTNSAVAELLELEGPDCLPLVYVNGELISKRRYPGNEQLQQLLKTAGFEVALGVKRQSACGCGTGSC
jgi:hypothetical protein